jgi:hypothetical protein
MEQQVTGSTDARYAPFQLCIAASQHQTHIWPDMGVSCEVGICTVGRLADTQAIHLPTSNDFAQPLTSRQEPDCEPIHPGIGLIAPESLCLFLRHRPPASLHFGF